MTYQSKAQIIVRMAQVKTRGKKSNSYLICTNIVSRLLEMCILWWWWMTMHQHTREQNSLKPTKCASSKNRLVRRPTLKKKMMKKTTDVKRNKNLTIKEKKSHEPQTKWDIWNVPPVKRPHLIESKQIIKTSTDNRDSNLKLQPAVWIYWQFGFISHTLQKRQLRTLGKTSACIVWLRKRMFPYKSNHVPLFFSLYYLLKYLWCFSDY